MKLQKNLLSRLVSIILLTLVVGGVVYLAGKIAPKSTLTKVCQISGVSVVLPNGLKYTCDTFSDGRFSRLGVIYWVKPISGQDPQISFNLGIDKFLNQNDFDKYVKDVVLNDSRFNFSLVNSNYKISGITGSYYEDKSDRSPTQALRRVVAVPSKLAIVTISERTDLNLVNNGAENTPKIDLNSIINSISFEKVANKPPQAGLSQTRICLTNDMNVMLPDRSGYSCSTLQTNIFSRITIEYYDSSMSNVTDSGGTPVLFSMEKFASQEEFKASSTTGTDTNAYFNTTNSNYPIHGTSGSYSEGGKSSRIIVPSKSTIIYVYSLDNLDYYKVNDSLKEKLKKEIDLIINSISF